MSVKMKISSDRLFLLFVLSIPSIKCEESKFLDDICGHINGQRIYLEYGESGTLEAKYNNNVYDRFTKSMGNSQKRCTVEFISCPSCVIRIKFKFLNLSRNCGRSTVFDACGCDYVWVYEPSFQQSSEEFCGRFIHSDLSDLKYHSRTRKVVVVFYYSKDYDHAFSLDYFAERNKIILNGFPKFGNMNNSSQVLSSPFFPNPYPSDLTMEHIVNCEVSNETCRISLVFTDFLIAPSSIIDFFDWNSERIYVTTGNIFRPPVITTSGPSLLIRFYANGAAELGFKAYYSFILGHVPQNHLTPNTDCGGQVNNLGGGITMMNMVNDGLKFFDCIWLIKPPEIYFHLKTHLYVKVVNFSGFAGSTELIIRQGLTSDGPLVENLKLSLPQFHISKEQEHTVSVSQSFYIRLKGLFRPESSLALVYAAFNYKNCLAGSDFLCRNKRCISSLLNCDGFDHCGDNSDELPITCSKDPRDRRQWSKTPNFLFPKNDGLSEIATSTMIFLLCSFGLIGFIFAMIVLLYRVNLKTRHQRQIQSHIETINAILEEGVGGVVEEIIIPDDPPDYEAPPDYDEVITKIQKAKKCRDIMRRNSDEGTTRSCQTSPIRMPDSPPPAYMFKSQTISGGSASTHFKKFRPENFQFSSHSSKIFSISRVLSRGNSDERYKCFSDSELTYELYAICDNMMDAASIGFGKSLTTDDVNIFI